MKTMKIYFQKLILSTGYFSKYMLVWVYLVLFMLMSVIC